MRIERMHAAIGTVNAPPAAPTGGAQGEAVSRKNWLCAEGLLGKHAWSPATWDSASIEPNVSNLDTMTSLTSGTSDNETSLHLKPDVLFATPHTPLHNDLINILICIVDYIHNGHWMNMFM